MGKILGNSMKPCFQPKISFLSYNSPNHDMPDQLSKVDSLIVRYNEANVL